AAALSLSADLAASLLVSAGTGAGAGEEAGSPSASANGAGRSRPKPGRGRPMPGRRRPKPGGPQMHACRGVFMGASPGQEPHAGGMVGSMDLRVTVQAAPVEHAAVRKELRGGRGVRIGLSGMARLVVALLAESRLLRDLHAGMERAVRVVAGEAVLAHGRVLP